MADNSQLKNTVELIEQVEPDLAIDLLRPVLRNSADRSSTYATLAYCYESKRAYSKAIYLYSSAMTLSPFGNGDPWAERLQYCKRLYEQEIKHLGGTLPKRKYVIIGWVVAGISGLLAAGFIFPIIPLLLLEAFDLLVEDGFIWILAGLSASISISALAYCINALRKQRRHRRAMEIAKGEDYTLLSHACPACNLKFRADSIECPWCGYEKEIEQAEQYADIGDYSSAYDCLRVFYNHSDPEIRRRVEPLCNEYLRCIKEREVASREDEAEQSKSSAFLSSDQNNSEANADQDIEAEVLDAKAHISTLLEKEDARAPEQTDAGVCIVCGSHAVQLLCVTKQDIGEALFAAGIGGSEAEGRKNLILNTCMKCGSQWVPGYSETLEQIKSRKEKEAQSTLSRTLVIVGIIGIFILSIILAVLDDSDYTPISPANRTKEDILESYHKEERFRGYDDPNELLLDMKMLEAFGSKDAGQVARELELGK